MTNRTHIDERKMVQLYHFVSGCVTSMLIIDQFRYIKIQAKTIDLSTRLWGINPTNSAFISQSLVLRSIVLGWILIYRNWSALYYIYQSESLIWSGEKALEKSHCTLAFKARRCNYIWYFRRTAENLVAYATIWLLTLSPVNSTKFWKSSTN